MYTRHARAQRAAPFLMFATALCAGVAGFAVNATALEAQRPAKAHLNQYGYPEKFTPRPTSAAITPTDLMTRLYQFADDSMMGRQIGRLGNMKGTAYIASELHRLGIQPGGDNGTYFQMLPNYAINKVANASLSVNGKPLTWLTDWVTPPATGAVFTGNEQLALTKRTMDNLQVIYGGIVGDSVNTITAEEANGKFVVVVQRPATPGAGGAGRAGGGRAGVPAVNKFAGAAVVATVNLDNLTPAQIFAVANPPQASAPRAAGRGGATPAPGAPAQPQLALRVTSSAANALFGGRDISAIPAGTRGGVVTGEINSTAEPRSEYARNVIGIIPGSDPVLKNEYVAIGAHNDHIGYGPKVDHDSAFSYRHQAMKMQIVGKDTIRPLTEAERASIHVNVDSLHRIRPARMDSIANGADDDGSGSMAVLEIAEAIAKMPVKPKRSTIFVWHTGEEAGLLGSSYFTEHPTVPITSIVSQINIDMIGRGRAEDLPGGGPDYLGVVGRNMLSPDLGAMVDAVNRKQAKPLKLDDRYDQDVSKTFGSSYNNIYQRSDHYNYARKGIPIAFFFTGLHGDYHQTTDEPQYIDYPHYARITNYIRDLIVTIGNNPKRPVVTKPVQ